LPQISRIVYHILRVTTNGTQIKKNYFFVFPLQVLNVFSLETFNNSIGTLWGVPGDNELLVP